MMSPVCHRPTTGRPAGVSLIQREDRPAAEGILGPERAGRTTEPGQTDQNLQTHLDKIITTNFVYSYFIKFCVLVIFLSSRCRVL